MSDVHVTSAEMVDEPWWDATLAGSPEATVFQCTGWARYLRDRHDVRFLRAETAAGQVAGLLLVQIVRPPARSLRALVGDGGHYTWKHGPVVLTGDPAAVTAALLAAVQREARRQGVRAVERATSPLQAPGPDLDRAWAGLGFRAEREATILVDLQGAEEELWRRLEPAARKAVHRCERDGVTTRRLASDEPLDDYLRVLRETRDRLRLGMPPHHPCPAIRSGFAGSAAAFEVFVAERDHRVLGGVGVIGFGPTVLEIALAQSTEAVQHPLYTSDLLKWAVIRWARAAGFRWYDLGGVAIDPSDPKALGIRRFKEKWGGRLVEYAGYDWNGPSLRHRALSPLRQLWRALAPAPPAIA